MLALPLQQGRARFTQVAPRGVLYGRRGVRRQAQQQVMRRTQVLDRGIQLPPAPVQVGQAVVRHHPGGQAIVRVTAQHWPIEQGLDGPQRTHMACQRLLQTLIGLGSAGRARKALPAAQVGARAAGHRAGAGQSRTEGRQNTHTLLQKRMTGPLRARLRNQEKTNDSHSHKLLSSAGFHWMPLLPNEKLHVLTLTPPPYPRTPDGPKAPLS